VPQLPSFEEGGVLGLDAGKVTLGSPQGAGFVFDNEKWAHAVAHGAFEIDRRPVTNREFAEFIEAGGYTRPELWSDAGREWLAAAGARHPVYWRRERRGWQLRRFDRWVTPEREPVIHVSRFEAEAYAAWRGRRLPTVAEWVRAAREPSFELGRCWEWTATEFGPYPGFSADPYADYSVPWFTGHAELRGAGSWVTSPALARATYRNFYTPDRRDPFVGFRTAQDR
jgi:ergothioneine biosynthesis protein EgtB